MKKLIIILSVFFTTYGLNAQNKSFPKIDLKNLDNSTVNTSSFENEDGLMVISFWATWCKPCVKELSAIAEVYEDWQDETGVKLIAISIDDTRTMPKVKPKVNAELWDYEVYCDPNSDLKRSLGINSVPHTFIINNNHEILYQHSGYKDGDEIELFAKIKKLSNK
ncbi:MAG: TlpA family protein disulfide reductase [Flavobacteriales bacterium]